MIMELLLQNHQYQMADMGTVLHNIHLQTPAVVDNDHYFAVFVVHYKTESLQQRIFCMPF